MAKFVTLLVSDESGEEIRAKLIPSGRVWMELSGLDGVAVSAMVEIDFLSRSYPTIAAASHAARHQGENNSQSAPLA